MPRREIYRRDRTKFRNAESARRRAKQRRVSAEELARLLLPENRLESLHYGAGYKCVCLNCGLICDNLSRHVSACPGKKQSSDQYSDQWGFARSTTLTSAAWQAEASRSRRGSARFQRAQERNRERWQEASDAQRKLVSEAKKSGHPIRRGPQRLQTVLAKRGRRLAPRPNRQKVSDTAIQRVMALDLPIAVAAKRAGLSQTAYYRRIQKLGWTSSEVRARRSVITRYLFDLRTWSRQQAEPPTLDRILDRHSSGLRGNEAGKFRLFTPYISHLEIQLRATPGIIGEVTNKRDSSAVITLAARVFRRARAGAKPGPQPQAPEEKKRFKVAQDVEKCIPRFTKLLEAIRSLPKRVRDARAVFTPRLQKDGWTVTEIDAAHGAKTAVVAARRYIAGEKNISHDSVAEYHRDLVRARKAASSPTKAW